MRMALAFRRPACLQTGEGLLTFPVIFYNSSDASSVITLFRMIRAFLRSLASIGFGSFGAIRWDRNSAKHHENNKNETPSRVA